MKILGAIYGALFLVTLVFCFFLMMAFITWSFDRLLDPVIIRSLIAVGGVGAVLGALLAD